MLLPIVIVIICCADRGTAIAGLLFGSVDVARFCVTSSLFATKAFFECSVNFVATQKEVPSAGATGAPPGVDLIASRQSRGAGGIRAGRGLWV